MSLLLLAALLGSPARAQEAAEVTRGPIAMRVPVLGTVVADDLFRLKSSIEGRVEAVLASSHTWSGADAPLALIADKSLAALIDARQTTPMEVLEERWQRVYQPDRVRCPKECFVLSVYARPKTQVLPRAVLFEAAASVQLVGHVGPEYRRWIHAGQPIEFWPVSDPQLRQTVTVRRFVLDSPGSKRESGGTLTADLDPRRSLDPGTRWEGRVLAASKKGVLRVPTRALIDYRGATYLAVRVSTGITTNEMTEVTAGAEEKRPYLALDPAALHGARPHHPVAEPLPPPTNDRFLDDGSGPNEALDDSPYDKPAADDDGDD